MDITSAIITILLPYQPLKNLAGSSCGFFPMENSTLRRLRRLRHAGLGIHETLISASRPPRQLGRMGRWDRSG